jgi:CRP-like cAMP-binding protein
MNAFTQYLKTNFSLSDEICLELDNHAESISVSKGEYFVKEGRVCRALAYIEEGLFRFCMYRDDEEITCFFVSEGQFVGDKESFINRIPSKLNAQALTPAKLICVYYDSYRDIEEKYPEFKDINAMLDRNVMMGLLGQKDLFYNLDAAARYKVFLEKFPGVIQRVPLSIVASFLGITQQSLSRLRKPTS